MRFGIDLGGTKTEGVVLDDRDPSIVIARQRVSTPQSEGYTAVLDAIASLVRTLESAAGGKAEALGIGTPGVIDDTTKLLKNSNTLCLNGNPIEADIARLLGIPVVVENDANCFALAEAVLGAGRGSECVFGIIMGTGVGGGVIFNGKIRHGAQGVAGEWGHNVIDPDGSLCYCGKRGCVETIISGPSLERYYHSHSHGVSRSVAEIIKNADNDIAAHDTVERLLTYFGKAVATVINILDPDVIVLGGGVSNVPLLYTEGIERVGQYVFNSTPKVPIVKNQLGDSAGVFGAALQI